MKQHSFMRLWSYLKVYKLSIILAIFLKVVSIVMSVLEPFVLGLAITESTRNVLDIAKGVEGASINTTYVFGVMALYLLRGLFYEIGAYYSNYFMTNAVQNTVRDMRNELSSKINQIPVSYFDKHQFGDLLGRFTSDVETVSNALQQSFLQVDLSDCSGCWWSASHFWTINDWEHASIRTIRVASKPANPKLNATGWAIAEC